MCVSLHVCYHFCAILELPFLYLVGKFVPKQLKLTFGNSRICLCSFYIYCAFLWISSPCCSNPFEVQLYFTPSYFIMVIPPLKGPKQRQKREMIQQTAADISRITVQKCEAGQQNYFSSCIPESKLIFLFSSVYNPTAMSRIDILNSQTNMDDTDTSWPISPCWATAALNLGWGSGSQISSFIAHLYSIVLEFLHSKH